MTVVEWASNDNVVRVEKYMQGPLRHDYLGIVAQNGYCAVLVGKSEILTYVKEVREKYPDDRAMLSIADIFDRAMTTAKE